VVSWAALTVGLAWGQAAEPAELWSAGPAYQEFRLTLEPGSRTEAAGPFYSLEQKPGERTLSVPPFFSRVEDSTIDALTIEVLFPGIRYARYGPEYRFQIGQLLSWSGGGNADGSKSHRTTVFPFYFRQKSTNPALEYKAVIPFYGHIEHRLFRDEVNWVMWPGYVQTRKKDVVTDNYLVPFFHLRHGDGLKGWQLWPLLGSEHKEITTTTNGFGDTSLVGGHDKFFALWPFYERARTGIGTTNPVSERLVLPLFHVERSPLRDSTSYLWPLGVTITDDREKKYREFDAPWPFVVFARGEGKTANRVWPLYGHAHNPYLQSDFYLWPLYRYSRAHSDPLDRERTQVLFFLYSDVSEKNTQSGKAFRRTDLWPLFTARRDMKGNERLQVLALIEPFIPNSRSVDRAWSPLWSIWRSERNASTGASSQSFLWNLYRCDATPASKKCSLLFGLIQYQSGSEGAHWRWFYLPNRKHQKHVSEHR